MGGKIPAVLDLGKAKKIIRAFRFKHLLPPVSFKYEHVKQHYDAIDVLTKIIYVSYLKTIYNIENIDDLYKLLGYRKYIVKFVCKYLAPIFSIVSYKLEIYNMGNEISEVYFDIEVIKNAHVTIILGGDDNGI